MPGREARTPLASPWNDGDHASADDRRKRLSLADALRVAVGDPCMRILLSVVLLAAVLSGAGCTKCGWIWDDYRTKSCRNG